MYEEIVKEVWRCAAEYGLRSMKDIAHACKLKYDTFCDRMKAPEKFTVYELNRMYTEIGFDLSVIGRRKKGK